MIQLNYYGRSVARVTSELMTAGSVGIQVALRFDEAWDGLTKVACFRGAGKTVDVALSGTGTGTLDPINIPAEVMAKAGARVELGVYGTNGEGTVVIPTVWAQLGTVKAGAIPSGTSPGAITPTLAQQVLTAAEAAQEAAEAAADDAEDAKAAAEAAQAAAELAATAAENKVICFAVGPDELGTGYECSMSLAKILEAAQEYPVCMLFLPIGGATQYFCNVDVNDTAVIACAFLPTAPEYAANTSWYLVYISNNGGEDLITVTEGQGRFVPVCGVNDQGKALVVKSNGRPAWTEAPVYTAQYTATADAETGELTFSETPDYADVRAAVVAGRTCKAAVTIGNDTYFAPLEIFHNPPQSQAWRVEYVIFKSPHIWVKELSNGSTTGTVETS